MELPSIIQSIAVVQRHRNKHAALNLKFFLNFFMSIPFSLPALSVSYNFIIFFFGTLVTNELKIEAAADTFCFISTVFFHASFVLL